MKSIGFRLCIAAIAISAVSTAANAAVSYTSVPFDQYPLNVPLPVGALPPPAPGQTMVLDFNNVVPADNPIVVPGGYSMSYTGAELHITPLVSGIAAPPAGDTTQYLAVLTGGEAILTTPILDSLSVLIGSIDNYNEITFKGADGFAESFSGYQLFPPANGDQFGESTNREFYFTFNRSDMIDEVDFTSSGNSFEFDNIAAAVPEPGIWMMLITGFGLMGLMMRRRTSASALIA